MPVEPPDVGRVHRRDYLRALAGTVTAGSLPLAGCGSADTEEPPGPTVPMDAEHARRLAERFAPTLYFDDHERWFPTDPRPFESERDGETVVDGFDAFDGYTRRSREADGPPDPTVFYRAVRYPDSDLGAVQWWAYSAFDQFATNFHWHDWEVLHAFVDLATDEPQLYVASAHSRSVPNNEYLDPDPAGVPHVLSELGSHSSALSVNEERETFQRLPAGTTTADITNAAVDALQALAELPAAYGLPRDEGFRLPYLVPVLDGRPIYDHPDLPAVDRASLVDESLTVRSFAELGSPPDSLPGRETGLVFGPTDREDAVDVTYELVPAAEVEHVAAFTGPQLRFEFAVPGFAEDLVAGHTTSTGVPWQQPRYADPVLDVSDPRHRQALADRYAPVDPPGGTTGLVASIRQVVESDSAPDGEGVETEEPTVEGVVLLESDPAALPTFRGAVVARDIPEGDHRLTVNVPGSAPHSESVSVRRDVPTVAGVEGAVPMVANDAAVKLGVDPAASDAELRRFAVEDDFAGRLYDAPLDGPEAVYVHRGGAYTAEVEDADRALGAFRVNPADGDRVTIDRPDTGKAVLSTYVADVIGESRDAVEARAPDATDSDPVVGLLRAMAAVATAASRAADRAEAGNRGRADEALERVIERLDDVAERLGPARAELPDPLGNALGRRLQQARRRADQALASEKL